MDISPQTITATTFRTVKRGYDPDEVTTFLTEVAARLEEANERATAMEARARAALAKLQEASQATSATPPGTKVPALATDDAETISRTLLLAQRTADITVAEAQAEAEAIRNAAEHDAAELLDQARAQATRLVDEARVEARRAGDAERVRVEGVVQSLLARREFLLSDVDHLEEFVSRQRHRLLEVAEMIQDLAERSEAGLGDMRRPLLSAAADGLRVEEPAELPVEMPVEMPAETPAKPALEPADEPVEESVEEAVDQPVNEPDESGTGLEVPDATPVAATPRPTPQPDELRFRLDG